MSTSRGLGLLRLLVLGLCVVAVALGALGSALAQDSQRHVMLGEVDGIINPVTQRYIRRVIQAGERDRAQAVIIRLDTPGGLLDSTRLIVEDMLNARVPTVVFVAPRGARAASAGTFITAAAHLAVMAPGTNIGAASPVGAGGEELPETLANKATQDAAALMRAIAQERGRNVEKLEETVLQATSFAATEAVELGVVNFMADDLEDLLQKLDGQTVTLDTGPVTLNTLGAEVRRANKSLVDSFLDFISDPNISFLLFSLGGLGVVIELLNPGLVLPGVLGAISLILAFLAFGNLPVNWAGVALLGLAAVLFVLELQVSGFGILGVGALISFLLGGFLLFFQFGTPSPTLPRIGVSWWVLGSTAGVMALIGGWVLWTAYQSRHAPGEEKLSTRLVRAVGTVTSDLAPRGTVHVGSEVWTAVAEDGNVILAGERVRVVGMEGLTLKVTRAREETPPQPGPSTTVS